MSVTKITIDDMTRYVITKDAEIERLKAQFQRAKEWNQLSEIQIKNLQSIVEDQQQLLARAANVLEIINKGWPISELGLDPTIIAELRKAAK